MDSDGYIFYFFLVKVDSSRKPNQKNKDQGHSLENTKNKKPTWTRKLYKEYKENKIKLG